LQTEQLGKRKKDRKAIYDIYCENERSERLIIEMQVGKQLHFMDRSIFYITFPIQLQAKKGDWDYQLKPVYHIAIVDFIHDESNDDYINRYVLMNEKGHTKISSNLIFITIELPKFKKKIEELESDLDMWMYCFCNLPTMNDRPAEIKGTVFDHLFEIVDTNNLTSEEMEGYKKSVAEYTDVRLMMECSLVEGREEGMLQGKRERENEIARNLLKMNFPLTDIAKATGLTFEQIGQLQSALPQV
jgi:predicted transposase/invertase (TIGR01784 family)